MLTVADSIAKGYTKHSQAKESAFPILSMETTSRSKFHHHRNKSFTSGGTPLIAHATDLICKIVYLIITVHSIPSFAKTDKVQLTGGAAPKPAAKLFGILLICPHISRTNQNIVSGLGSSNPSSKIASTHTAVLTSQPQRGARLQSPDNDTANISTIGRLQRCPDIILRLPGERGIVGEICKQATSEPVPRHHRVLRVIPE